MPYQIRFEPAAIRDIRRLPDHVRPRVERAIKGLAANPRPAGAEALQGGPGLLRIRVAGSYRVIYEVRDDDVVVIVVATGHRREVYRRLGR